MRPKQKMGDIDRDASDVPQVMLSPDIEYVSSFGSEVWIIQHPAA